MSMGIESGLDRLVVFPDLLQQFHGAGDEDGAERAVRLAGPRRGLIAAVAVVLGHADIADLAHAQRGEHRHLERGILHTRSAA